MTKPASSALRRWAPLLLIATGLGLIGAGAAAEYLLPGRQTLSQIGLTGTVFGLAAKLGGALFFGGLFAFAAAGPTDKSPVTPSGPAPSASVTAAALRAARMAREQRDRASA